MADLYVSWSDYHKTIERLAAKVHESGWQFNQIVCIARGGLRVGDVMSRIFKLPLAIIFTSSYVGEARDAARRDQRLEAHVDDDARRSATGCCSSTTWSTPGVTLDVVKRHLAEAASRREGDPHRGALVQGRVRGTSPTTSSSTSPRAPGSTSRSSRTT